MLRFRRNSASSYARNDTCLRVRLGLSLARRAGGVDGLLWLPGSDSRRPGVRLALLRAVGGGALRAPSLTRARVARESTERPSRIPAPTSDRSWPAGGASPRRRSLRAPRAAVRHQGSRTYSRRD